MTIYIFSSFLISFKKFSRNFNGDIFLLASGVSNAFGFGIGSCVGSGAGSGAGSVFGSGVGVGVGLGVGFTVLSWFIIKNLFSYSAK